MAGLSLRMISVKLSGISLCCILALVPVQGVYPDARTTPLIHVSTALAAALEQITPDRLKGDVSFLASDALEGRATPSRGLEVAAEYIAARFRAAGLEPAGTEGYFQIAGRIHRTANLEGFRLELRNGDQILRANAGDVALVNDEAVEIDRASVYKVSSESSGSLKATDIEGKVVVFLVPEGREGRSRLRSIRRMGAALVIAIADRNDFAASMDRLLDPAAMDKASPLVVLDTLHGREFAESLPGGDTVATASVTISKALDERVDLKNVAGLLRGSSIDPGLRDSVVILSAHYDHIGIGTPRDGDKIYNGANDDASGTAAVIQIASALASLEQRPKRSILFMAFFGEERGLLGSRHYVRHPLFPFDQTVANVNLEQLGRTDGYDSRKLATATLTGYGYSNIPDQFQRAGELTGVKVLSQGDTNRYFSRSDNYSFARRDIPAHTLAVLFEFPDYHGVDDEWEKLDYDNFAKVTRMAALGTFFIADDPVRPHWNETMQKKSAE